AKIWERSEQCILEGRTCRRLSKEDHVLYLCVHLAVEHSLRGLLWFCDLDRLIRHSPPDWNHLRDSAGTAGLLRALRCCLTELNRLYETPIPSTLMVPQFRSIQGKRFRRNEYLLPFFLMEKSKRWAPLWEFLRLSPGKSLFGKIRRGARILTRILRG
ncbi:MAG: nucleotidyltransferase family protein, partial [Armatimonadetes bacterium]|nr:nucleotidyltransferase family protein [Armatimonadota bacterium]